MLPLLFSVALAEPPEAELMFHGGLLQPLLMNGLNAAVDLRVDRLVLSYSHGEGLDLSRLSLAPEQRADGLQLGMPFSTGGGAGLTLWKELYVLGDVKVHQFEIRDATGAARYTTLTLGGELGYRLLVWKGLTVTPVVRYWPRVWSSEPDGVILGDERFLPAQQGLGGLFANVLLGWAFDLPRKSATRP